MRVREGTRARERKKEREREAQRGREAGRQGERRGQTTTTRSHIPLVARQEVDEHIERKNNADGAGEAAVVRPSEVLSEGEFEGVEEHGAKGKGNHQQVPQDSRP